MALNTLEKLYVALRDLKPRIELSPEVMDARARAARADAGNGRADGRAGRRRQAEIIDRRARRGTDGPQVSATAADRLSAGRVALADRHFEVAQGAESSANGASCRRWQTILHVGLDAGATIAQRRARHGRRRRLRLALAKADAGRSGELITLGYRAIRANARTEPRAAPARTVFRRMAHYGPIGWIECRVRTLSLHNFRW